MGPTHGEGWRTKFFYGLTENAGHEIAGHALASIRLQYWGDMSEARRAESGSGVLGEGQPAPPHQLGCLGERCKHPQWGLGRSPGRLTI